jgi:hypothetical protein
MAYGRCSTSRMPLYRFVRTMSGYKDVLDSLASRGLAGWQQDKGLER